MGKGGRDAAFAGAVSLVASLVPFSGTAGARKNLKRRIVRMFRPGRKASFSREKQEEREIRPDETHEPVAHQSARRNLFSDEHHTKSSGAPRRCGESIII